MNRSATVALRTDVRRRFSAIKGFHLSDPVLIAIATTTTANLIGTLLVVARYLFPITTAIEKTPLEADQAPDAKAPAGVGGAPKPA